MANLRQEARVAVRYLGRNSGTTLAAILTMALGIGACTAIFSVVDGVLLKPLPYPDPDRIIQVWQVGSTGGHMQTSDPNFLEWQEQSRSFAGLAQYSSGISSVVGGSEPVRARVGTVSRDFFSILAVQPFLGRTFTGEELVEGGTPAVIVSHGFWQQYLDGDRDLSRHALSFSNRNHNVVGVMPPGFSFPVGAELWIPREIFGWNDSKTAHNWLVIGRLKEELSFELAQQEMHTIGRRQKEVYGEEIWLSDIDLVPLREQMVGRVRTQLWLLLGAVGFLLLVACANVTNLLLAKAAARRKEVALRSALGAAGWDLVRQSFLESLLMTLAGGVLGVLLAAGGVRLLLLLEPGNLPRIGEVQINATVLLFALALSAITAVVLGVLPASRIGDRMYNLLKESGRGQTSGSSSNRLRNALVVTQVAITLVLLVGAALLGRSFQKLMEIDPGFRLDGIVTLEISKPWASSPEDQQRLVRFLNQSMDALRQLPGIRQVGGVDSFPLGPSYANGQFLVATSYQDWAFATDGGPPDFERFGKLAETSEKGYAEYRLASRDYFTTMGIPLVDGRFFEFTDTPDSPHVGLISKSLADTQWPGQNPIGKLIQFGNMDSDLHLIRVVGVVGDVRDYGVASPARPTIYMNFEQRPRRAGNFTIAMHGEVPAETVIAGARRALREIDPDLPLQFSTLGETFDSSLSDRRFGLLLLAIFGIAALSLAAIGIFAVMAYTVAQRRQEIGVRIALGAPPGRVRRLVLGQGLMVAGAGVVLGLLGSAGLTRLMASLLFEISTLDPLAYLAAVPLLLGVSLLACYLPAFRASRVDPLEALRAE